MLFMLSAKKGADGKLEHSKAIRTELYSHQSYFLDTETKTLPSRRLWLQSLFFGVFFCTSLDDHVGC
uniref:Uncharacterized protein n=1 Tax=Anguilla anguilla TaxID=7936 RepID=A0A0E9TAU7_ANGAN